MKVLCESGLDRFYDMANRVRVIEARNADEDVGFADLLKPLFYFIS